MGSEVVVEGVIEGRKREIEGPFGEFTGHYSGGRNMTVIRIDRISYRDNPIFELLYHGMPWTEIDYLMAANARAPLYEQLKKDFPEAGRQRHVHPRPRRHRVHQDPLRGLRSSRRPPLLG